MHALPRSRSGRISPTFSSRSFTVSVSLNGNKLRSFLIVQEQENNAHFNMLLEAVARMIRTGNVSKSRKKK